MLAVIGETSLANSTKKKCTFYEMKKQQCLQKGEMKINLFNKKDAHEKFQLKKGRIKLYLHFLYEILSDSHERPEKESSCKR